MYQKFLFMSQKGRICLIRVKLFSAGLSKYFVSKFMLKSSCLCLRGEEAQKGSVSRREKAFNIREGSYWSIYLNICPNPPGTSPKRYGVTSLTHY